MNTKSIIAFAAVAVAFALLVAPLAAANVDASSQSVTGKQKIKQSGGCVAITCTNSGNNFASNFQFSFSNQVSGTR